MGTLQTSEDRRPVHDEQRVHPSLELPDLTGKVVVIPTIGEALVLKVYELDFEPVVDVRSEQTGRVLHGLSIEGVAA